MAVGRRGRKKLTEKHWLYFDAKGYIEALHKSLRPVAFELRAELIDRLKQNVMGMEMSRIPALRADGTTTSDLERVNALLSSIVPERGVIDMANGVIRMVVSAMGDNFEDSHIGYYYEWGTGTYEDKDSPLYKYGDWNTYRGTPRPGAPIVTRGTHRLMAASSRAPKAGGKAVAVGAYTRKSHDTTRWTDMAGVPRLSNSRIGGLPIKSPGYETIAYHWYSRAYKHLKDTYYDKIKDAVFKIDPRDYIHVKAVINLR